ncbi:MAG: hypothetical protein J6O13_13050 [Selenomonas sp.]|nr:hypothetical protein [Selenomonas sp.]
MNYEAMAIEILETVTGTAGLEEDKALDLFEAGLLDSLAAISIIVQIEEKTGVVLQPTDFQREDISSVTALAKYLEANDIK